MYLYPDIYTFISKQNAKVGYSSVKQIIGEEKGVFKFTWALYTRYIFEEYPVVIDNFKILFHIEHCTLPQKFVTGFSIFYFQGSLNSVLKISMDDVSDMHFFVVFIAGKLLI